MAATAIEYALMAGAVYQDTKAQINWIPLPTGWAEIEHIVNKDSGFEVSQIKRGNEIVISFAGTATGVDWTHGNIPLAAGDLSDQLRQAADYYLKVKALNPTAAISFTGHSLGGGLASLMAVLFGESAFTFDQAPFRNSALSFNTVGPNGGIVQHFAAQDLRTYLTGRAPESLLAPLDAFIAAAEPFNPNPIVADTLAARETRVTDINVQGEILGYLPFSRIGTQADISQQNNMAIPLGQVSLHSQALLTAFLQSNKTADPNKNLSDATYKLLDLLKMIFDPNLFYHDPSDKENPHENFLERVVKHEAGAGATATTAAIPADAMVTRFTADLWKLAQDGGLTMSDNVPTNAGVHELSKALTAFAMQFYYEDTANAKDKNKQLFIDLAKAGEGSNGIRFDLHDVSKDIAAMMDANAQVDLAAMKDGKYLLKGYEYFLNYLNSGDTVAGSNTFPTGQLSLAERTLIKSMVSQLRDWYVQAGNSGMLAADNLNRGAFMLGGNSGDALKGGTAADLLVGNAGDDVLQGGKGNDMLMGGSGNDTYVYTSGDGFDTILDSDGKGSIAMDGNIITGGKQFGDKRVFKGTDAGGQSHTYVFVNGDAASGGDLLVDNNILIKNCQAGQLGLPLAPADAVADPATTALPLPGDLISTAQYQTYTITTYTNMSTYTASDGTVLQNFYTQDTSGNDALTTGDDRDYISLTQGGDDIINSGAGQDYVNAGAGNDVVIGGAGSDILNGGTGNDRLYADTQMTVDQAISSGNTDTNSTAKGDWLSGGSGEDTLVGSAAGDLLFGGGGSDLLIGGAGNDIISGDAAYDGYYFNVDPVTNQFVFDGTSYDWTITKPSLNTEKITGVTNEADYTSPDGAADVIYAGNGDDFVVGGLGNDIIFGGEGNDTIWGDDNNISGNDYIEGGKGDDNLIGGRGGDIYVYNTGDGNDKIFDTIVAGDTNTLRFGAGIALSNLRLSVGDTGYVLTLSDGSTLQLMSGASGFVNEHGSLTFDPQHTDIQQLQFADGSSIGWADFLKRGLVQHGTSKSVVLGSEYNDILSGANSTLVGGAGSDTYSYQAGDGVVHIKDFNIGGDTNTLRLGPGITASQVKLGLGSLMLDLGNGDQIHIDNFDPYDAVNSSTIQRFEFADGTVLNVADLLAGGFDLEGTAGNDVISGTSVTDRINGYEGDDTLMGGAGKDVLDGGAGADSMSGGTGDDLYIVDNVADVVVEDAGAGNDTVQSSVSYTLSANVENLVLTGTANLWGSGNSLDNVITANSGNDTLDGGAGNDTLYGGAGQDTFLMSNGMGQDTVIDRSSQGGVVQLQSGMSLSDVLMVQQGNDMLIQSINNPNDSMLIQGYYTNPQTSWTLQDSFGAQTALQPTTDSANMRQALAVLRAERYCNTEIQAGWASVLLSNGFTLQPDGSLTKVWEPSPMRLTESVSSSTSASAMYYPSLGGGITASTDPRYAGFYWIGNNYVYYSSVDTYYNNQKLYIGSWNSLLPLGLQDGGTIMAYSWSPNGVAYVAYPQTGSIQITQSPFSSSWYTYGGESASRETFSVNTYSTTADAPVIYSDNQTLGFNWNQMTMWQQVKWVQDYSYGNLLMSYSLWPDVTTNSVGYYVVNSFQVTQVNTTTEVTSFQGIPVGPLVSSPGTLATPLSVGAYLNGSSVYGSSGVFPQAMPVAYVESQLTYNIQTINVKTGGHTVYDSGGHSYVNAWSGDNTIIGGAVAYSGSGNDLIDRVNTVYGGSGNDTISNASAVYSGSGNDSISYAQIVYSGSGNDSIERVGTVYGGTGNDTIVNSSQVYAGSGNDLLVNDEYVVAGSGSDTILGATQVDIDPNKVGNDVIGGKSSDDGYSVLNAFYQSQGISDWYNRYTNPSSSFTVLTPLQQTLLAFSYQLQTQLIPNIQASPQTAAVIFDDFLANVKNAILSANVALTAAEQSILFLRPLLSTVPQSFVIDYISTLYSFLSEDTVTGYEPLPVLAVVDGSSLQPSSYYSTSTVPVTHFTANNFAALDALKAYLQPAETVNIGVLPSDLHLSWGQITTTLSGSPADIPSKYMTLNITWGTNNQSVQVIIPHSTDPIGTGLVDFNFADGTTMTLGQMVALAPPAPSFDPQLSNFTFDMSMGAQTLAAGVSTIQFAAGIDPSAIGVTQDAQGNFVISYNNGASTLTISAQSIASSPAVATFANGTKWEFVNAAGNSYTYVAGSGMVYLQNPSTVQFGTGITSNMITLGVGSLMLRLGNGTGDVLHIEGFNPNDALNSTIQSFQFADGTTLSYADLLARGFDIYGTTGNETLTGTNLDNRIYAGTGNDVLIGSGAHDTLYGGIGNDTLIAGSGTDLLIAGSGLATMIGGTGNDTFVVNNTADVVQAQSTGANVNTIETSVSYTASANVQNITGIGTSDIVLTGNDLANTVTANSGNDTLIAGTGVATMVGGTGNDTFVVNDVNDVVQAQSTGSNINTVLTSVSYVAPANAQNLTGTGTADIVLTGNDLANTITANSGNDTLVAGSGVATLVGGTGNDTFVVNNVNDVVLAQSSGSNVNTIFTSVNYVAPANVQNLIGTGTADITLTGNDLNNTITANSGNDMLIAGTGVATMVGGTGNDTFVVNDVNDVVQAQATGSNVNTILTSVNYVAPANVQNLTGTGTADITLTGNDLNNVITANSGNDTLIAGSGLATMIGGTGNDIFFVNNAADVVQAQATGSNINTVLTSVSYVAPANVQNLTGTGTDDISLTGNSLNNVITANSGNDTLIAGTGVATMIGGAGSDTFVVNNSADIIQAQLTGSNVNTVYSSVDFNLATNAQNVQNLVGTGTANITFADNSLNNVITANSGNDTLISTSGNDTLISGAGVDTMIGGTGNDTFVVNNSADLIQAQLTGSNVNTALSSVNYDMATNAQNVQILTGTGTADLILIGNNLNDTITANSGNDLLKGGTGNNTLIGGSGADVLEGGSGNNVLTDTQGRGILLGGRGSDTLIGGGGNSFFAGGLGNDIVTPGALNSVVAFNAGDGADTVMTPAGGANTLSLGGTINFNNLTLARNGNDLILDVSASDSITFHDWYAGTANGDFSTLQIIGPQNANVLGGALSGHANEFDFAKIVSTFDQQTANKPPLSPWHMTSALVQAHLSSSDTAALGGDLAYYYGSQGSLAGMNLPAAQTTLKDPNFGTQAQTLHPLQGLQGGPVTL